MLYLRNPTFGFLKTVFLNHMSREKKCGSTLLNISSSTLSRCCTSKWSSTRFSLVGPTKVKARKSYLFSEKFLYIENKDTLKDKYTLRQKKSFISGTMGTVIGVVLSFQWMLNFQNLKTCRVVMFIFCLLF